MDNPLEEATWTENRNKFTQDALQQVSTPKRNLNEVKPQISKQWKNTRRFKVSKETLGHTPLNIITQILLKRLDTIIKHIPTENRNAFYMCKDATLSLYALLQIERPLKNVKLITAHADRPMKASLSINAQNYRQAHEREGEIKKRITIKLPGEGGKTKRITVPRTDKKYSYLEHPKLEGSK